MINAIYDESGNVVVLYEYDAWGKLINISGATVYLTLNPFLYKSYYYDHESSLYYCLTRYYVPDLMRWLNGDDVNYLTDEHQCGYNLFTYCNNNPVMYEDPDGTIAISTIILIAFGVVLAAGVGTTIGGICSGNEVAVNAGDSIISGAEIGIGAMLIATGVFANFGMTLFGTGVGSFTNGLINMSNGGSYHAGWLGGEVAGLISYIPYFGSSIGSFVGSALTDYIDSGYSFDGIDLEKAGTSAAISFGLSWSNGIANFTSKELNTATRFVLSYNYSYLSISNSVINTFWRKKYNG